LPMWRQLEFVFLQVFHENLRLGSQDFHGAGCVCGSNFTTSL
jgi:hypothetical protein